MATVLTRWFAPMVLAAGLGTVAATTPAPARAGDDWARVVVDVADVIYHGGYPYYRYDRGYRDRLVVVHDYRGRPNYYRRVYRAGPPYGNAYGYWNSPRGRCNKHGKCTTHYYDARYDRRYDRGYYHHDRRWDDRRYHRDYRDRYERRWRGD
jgi:hypothetical protein